MITHSVSITHTHYIYNNSELADTPLAVALGTLTGPLLLILVLVVTGWVWTCWTLKKRKEETQHCQSCQVAKYPTRACVSMLDESGQSINGLSSNDNKGEIK